MKDPSKIIDKKFRKQLKTLIAQNMSAKLIKAYFEENAKDWPNLNLSKIPVMYYTKETNDRYFATRFTNDLVNVFKDVNTKDKAMEKIAEITDTGIQKILKKHLEKNNNNAELAFSADGIDEMNRNIVELNNGKFHQPIYTVRKYEKANKFAIGSTGNKGTKFVEAAKGTNLFFAVYTDENGKRFYDTIPLNVVIDRQKQKLPSVPETDGRGNKLLFSLSPNDLVVVNNEIYKMVSSSGTDCFFTKASVATTIVDKKEFSPLNKMQKTIDGIMIKEKCVPIKVDRLGNVIGEIKM